MIQRIGAAMIALVLMASFSTASFAGDAKKEMKSEAAMGPMKTVSCPAPCEFSVRSHDEKEIISIVKMHAKKKHKKDMTDKQIREMMKTEGTAESK